MTNASSGKTGLKSSGPATKTMLVVDNPTQVAKSIIYLLLTAAAIYLQSKGVLDVYVIVAMIVAVLGVIPVYFVETATWKVVTGFALALGQGLLVVIGQAASLGTLEAISPYVWVGLIVSAAAAIGLGIVPNTPLTPVQVPLDTKPTWTLFNSVVKA